MIYSIGAGLTLLAHLAFIVFVVLGALLTMRWRWLVVLHLPAAIWGAYVMLAGRACPLTDLENFFRRRAGQAGYSEGFIEHYLLPIIYPEGLSPTTQLLLGALAIIINVALYARLIRQHRVAGPGGPR